MSYFPLNEDHEACRIKPVDSTRTSVALTAGRHDVFKMFNVIQPLKQSKQAPHVC